jgi:hypothetical protein
MSVKQSTYKVLNSSTAIFIVDNYKYSYMQLQVFVYYSQLLSLFKNC